MASHTYIALLEAAPEGGYGVSFPDLPGCVSAGDDLDDAVAQAEEALSLHLEGMIEDGEAFPRARSMTDIDHDLRCPAGIVYGSIKAEVEDGGERVNVYLPKTLLAQIEAFGQRTGMDNRSTFFRIAARRMLNSEASAPFQVTARFMGRTSQAGCGTAAEAIRMAELFFQQDHASNVVIEHGGRPYSPDQLKAAIQAGELAAA